MVICRHLLLLLAVLLGVATSARTARATPPSVPHPFAYAIVVGSNVGGPGQAPLHYAEDDALRMAAVLKDLGRFGATDLRVLLHPDGAKILAALDEVLDKLKAHQERGEQAVLVFYYSGHAKATAINLGDDELPLATLRERLRQLPSTLTLVVLDAMKMCECPIVEVHITNIHRREAKWRGGHSASSSGFTLRGSSTHGGAGRGDRAATRLHRRR